MGWMFLLLPLLVANVVCLTMAIAFNNLSSKRQFPLYWLGGRQACVCNCRDALKISRPVDWPEPLETVTV